MKSRRLLNVSEDRLTPFGSRTRSLASLEKSLESLPIPKDLVVEIFSRLPSKSIARYRCLSKYWATVFCDQYFIEMFMANSSVRPQLLFACVYGYGFFLFSSHQPQNLDEKVGAITADLLTHVPYAYEVNRPVNGFVCIRGQPPVSLLVIYNPSTKESITLPKIKTRNKKIMLTTYSYLGYDPIGKQFKVLSMTLPDYHTDEYQCEEYQVLTLGTEKKSYWKMIQCCKPHVPQGTEICIKGVLYYQAVVDKESPKVSTLVCFDIRSEKFSFMKVMETFNRALPRSATLINYNGKLGLLMTEESSDNVVSGRSKSFELWVLEDAGKHEWSKHVYMLPPLWKNVVGEETMLSFLGIIGTDEIVLSYNPYMFSPSYVFYYNIKRNTIIRLEIQGMEAFDGKRCYIFLDHVENIKLIQAF